MKRNFWLLCVLVLVVGVTLMAQEQQTAPPLPGVRGQPQAGPQKPLLSPRGQSESTFTDGKEITVDYGRPSMRGRKIMGELVPYGKIWRTGANEATGFVTDADLIVGGVNVPAGKYTMYTLPSEGTWKLIINRQTGQWGTHYDEAQDLARI